MNDITGAIRLVTGVQIAMQKATGPDVRGQHFKMHGCVDATFRVRADIPDALKVGLFAAAREYRAFVRFSNGAMRDDRNRDIHGMAIKLLDVPGKKVLEVEADSTEHDFILADNPVFFIRTAADYAVFMPIFAEAAQKRQEPEKFYDYLKGKGLGADVAVIRGFRQQLQDNPLTSRYWSQVPYALGSQAGTVCRYRCSPSPMTTSSGTAGPTHDYLRERMVQRLAANQPEVVFDFEVQSKTGADNSVIDNPTVEWPEPFIPVATVHIGHQVFDTQQRRDFGERLSYSPWHALPEHRPVGEVNDIRKTVYLASKKLRDETVAVGRENLRLTQEELTRNIDDDFKSVIDRLQATFGFLAGQKRGRATHTWGAAGRGTARFIVAPEFPRNDYFVAGKTVPVILRHSSPGAREDDRARDGVAASVKFFPQGSDYSGPGDLDILMNAGRQLFVRTIRDFSTFVHAVPPPKRKQLVEQGIMMEPELIEAYRIRGSFLDSRYHSWQCFEFFDAAGVMRYIRFRLIPGDRGPERGLPAKEFRADGEPSMDPVPDDPRAPDFLRQEWIYQVKYSEVSYILQAQLHDAPKTDEKNPEVLNPAKAWDETQHPWMDLCEIKIEETIDREATSKLDMNPNRSPQCIKIPLATSPDQYASLGHARAIVYPGARSVRAAAEKPENN